MRFKDCFVLAAVLCMTATQLIAMQEGGEGGGGPRQVVVPALRIAPAADSPSAEHSPTDPPAALPEEFTPASVQTLIRLNNGDYLQGRLLDSPDSFLVGLSCPSFAEPLAILPGYINSIDQFHVPLSEGISSVYQFRLLNGDQFWGEPVEWNDKVIVVESSQFGILKLNPNLLHSMIRRSSGGEVLFSEPWNLKHWNCNEPDAWYIESSSLVSRKLGSRVIGDAKLSERCRIQLSLSWTGKPNFVIALGVPEQAKNSGEAFSIEVWDDKLALLREVGKKAEAAFLTSVDSETTSVDLNVYLDQKSGRAIVYTSEYRLLADIALPSENPNVNTFISAENFGRELRLDSIQVFSWNGEIRADRHPGSSTLQLVDGRRFEGGVIAANKERGWFIRTAEEGDFWVGYDDLESLIYPTLRAQAEWRSQALNDAEPETTKAKQVPGEKSNKAAPLFESSALGGLLFLQNKTRLTGVWKTVQQGSLIFEATAALDAVKIPVSEIHSFRAAYRGTGLRIPATDGALYSSSAVLRGTLDDSNPETGTGLFRWLSPVLSSPVEIERDIEGRLDFRRLDSSRTFSTGIGTQDHPGRPALLHVTPQTDSAAPRRTSLPNIRLRSGERFMAEVIQIDERGVYFKNASTPTGFVENDQIHSLELRGVRRAVAMDPKKLERFLTVPRMLKEDPPTHVLVSLDGDYLRGRLIRMTEAEATMEVKLSEVRIPSASISQIIWLYERAWPPSSTASTQSQDQTRSSEDDETNSIGIEGGAAESPASAPMSAPSLPMDSGHATYKIHLSERAGWSLNLEPMRVAGRILVGRHPLLGEYAVDLKSVEYILFGSEIEKRAIESASNPWKLSLAKIPRVFADASGDGDDPQDGLLGDDSPLVGNPAPKLQGETLDGQSFALAELKGRIVVLDFWASWCGPCMQSMPLLDAAIREIDHPDVDLIAVNLEESAERAAAAMTRLKLDTRVVLDIDGAAGQRYQANAIPQTVIIDREGVVRNVFVGGGASIVSEIRRAVEKLLGETAGS